MSGTMPVSKRNAAIARLRKAAEARGRAFKSGHIGAIRKAEQDLEKAWRAFPECERDEVIPRYLEILTICDRLDQEEEERLRRESL